MCCCATLLCVFFEDDDNNTYHADKHYCTDQSVLKYIQSCHVLPFVLIVGLKPQPLPR